jgi:hypothetical protein
VCVSCSAEYGKTQQVRPPRETCHRCGWRRPEESKQFGNKIVAGRAVPKADKVAHRQAYQKAYHGSHVEQERERTATYRSEHCEEIRLSKAAYYNKHKEAACAAASKRHYEVKQPAMRDAKAVLWHRLSPNGQCTKCARAPMQCIDHLDPDTIRPRIPDG